MFWISEIIAPVKIMIALGISDVGSAINNWAKRLWFLLTFLKTVYITKYWSNSSRVNHIVKDKLRPYYYYYYYYYYLLYHLCGVCTFIFLKQTMFLGIWCCGYSVVTVPCACNFIPNFECFVLNNRNYRSTCAVPNMGVSVVHLFRAFHLRFTCIFWMILRWFHFPLLLVESLVFLHVTCAVLLR